MLDSSQAPTLALPTFLVSLLLLAASPAFANAEGAVDGGQSANSTVAQTSSPSESDPQNTKAPALGQNNASINLQKVNGQLLLEARQAPLAQILKQIADKTGAKIHYSVLPEASVTATCIGKSVQEIMACLVGKQVGLVAHKPQKDKPAEFWLLGSSVGSCRVVSVTASPIQSATEPQPTPEAQAEMERMMQEQSDQLLQQAKSKIPSERQIAIMNLASVGSKDDPNVDDALTTAMTDKDPSVRVQAVTAIAQRGGDNFSSQIAQVLKDQDANVRALAVSLVENDANLLQQALTDSDQAVRDAARAKLEQITSSVGGEK